MKKYRMLEVIGDGTYGQVWKGVYIESGEKVAIKKLKTKIKTWQECIDLKEVKALSKLKSHPNIIKLKEIVRESNSDVYFIFEYADTNLYEYIESFKKKGEKIPENKIKQIIQQISNGLSYTHLNGYFHRDLKPENILLMSEEMENNTNSFVKIADFGLAKEIPSYHSNALLTDYVCTRWYRPPECILKSTNYTSSMDIWAIGCIMAELYMLTPIFPGNSEFDQLTKVINIIGTPKFNDWPEGYKLIQKLGLKFSTASGIHLSELCNKANMDGINLLYEILNWDPIRRPTCSKIMSHIYFEDNTSKNKQNNYEKYIENNSTQNGYSTGRGFNNTMIGINAKSNESYLNNFNYNNYKNNKNSVPEINDNNFSKYAPSQNNFSNYNNLQNNLADNSHINVNLNSNINQANYAKFIPNNLSSINHDVYTRNKYNSNLTNTNNLNNVYKLTKKNEYEYPSNNVVNTKNLYYDNKENNILNKFYQGDSDRTNRNIIDKQRFNYPRILI